MKRKERKGKEGKGEERKERRGKERKWGAKVCAWRCEEAGEGTLVVKRTSTVAGAKKAANIEQQITKTIATYYHFDPLDGRNRRYFLLPDALILNRCEALCPNFGPFWNGLGSNKLHIAPHWSKPW